MAFASYVMGGGQRRLDPKSAAAMSRGGDPRKTRVRGSWLSAGIVLLCLIRAIQISMPMSFESFASVSAAESESGVFKECSDNAFLF
jgi:hypothetical protein